MKKLHVPEFETYEEEADFWDNLDTGDFMEDDGEWFRFETPTSERLGLRFSLISRRNSSGGRVPRGCRLRRW